MTKLGKWYEESWIQLPRSDFFCAEEAGYYFKPNLVPVSLHPLVKEAGVGVSEELQILHLYHYLDDVDTLETEVINKSLQNIFRGSIPLHIPNELWGDAYKIYIDEGFHAFMSYELKNEISAQTQIKYSKPHILQTVTSVNEQIDLVDPELWPLAQLLASATNETMISANLLQCNDVGLKPTISTYLSSHLRDEAKHHIYFAELFQVVWNQLLLSEKKTLGLMLPKIIKSLLSINKRSICLDLIQVGFDRGNAELIFEESYQGYNQTISRPVKSTLRLFEKCRIFEIKEVRNSFLEEKIILPIN